MTGRQLLQYFLRLKIANQLGADRAHGRVGTQELRNRLMRGETMEIAGYTLSPALALAIDAAELSIAGPPGHVAWLEVSTGPMCELGPASRSRIEEWRRAGHQVDAVVVEGNRFWQTVEISECTALVDATLSATESWKM
jgi:hypothetical protein